METEASTGGGPGVEKKIVGSFVATNAAGQRRVVYVVSVGGAAPTGPAGENWYLVTEEGYRVDRLEKGRYREVLTKEQLTSDAPDAP